MKDQREKNRKLFEKQLNKLNKSTDKKQLNERAFDGMRGVVGMGAVGSPQGLSKFSQRKAQKEEKINEGPNRLYSRAKGIINSKDARDLKNGMNGIMFDLIDDGFEPAEALEVVMLYVDSIAKQHRAK